MQKKFFLVFVMVCCCGLLFAQSAKPKYNALVATGLVGGKSGPALQLQAINGISYKTWSAGIGVGLDHYRIRTVPLFLDLRKAFSESPKAGFAYLSGGYNVPWLSKANAESADHAFVQNTNRGLYAEGGLGFGTPIFKTHRFFVSMGWQLKTYSQTVNTMPWISRWPPPEEAYRNYDYRLTCFTFKAGLQL